MVKKILTPPIARHGMWRETGKSLRHSRAEKRRVSPHTTVAVAVVASRCFKVWPLTTPSAVAI